MTTKIKSKGVTKRLTPSDFSDAQFMTATEKCRVAKAFEGFLVARLNWDGTAPVTDHGVYFPAWTEATYKHFSLHLGHIAHYDRWGFFAAQWEEPADLLRNIGELAADKDQYGRCISGDFAYGDLNKQIVAVANAYYQEVCAACGVTHHG